MSSRAPQCAKDTDTDENRERDKDELTGELQGGGEMAEEDGEGGAGGLPAPTLLGTDRGADTGRPTARSTESDTNIERDTATERHQVTGRDKDGHALSRLKAWNALVALDIAKKEYSRAHDLTLSVSAEAADARQTGGESAPKAVIELLTVTETDIETNIGAEVEASTRGVEVRTAWPEEEAGEDKESILKRDVLEERRQRHRDIARPQDIARPRRPALLSALFARPQDRDGGGAAAAQTEARSLNARVLEEREVKRAAEVERVVAAAKEARKEAQAFINSVYQGEDPLGARPRAESGAEVEAVARAEELVQAYLPSLWPLLDLVEAEYVDEDDLSWKLLSLFDILYGQNVFSIEIVLYRMCSECVLAGSF
jgi:hypothetical protein